jgi:hypothetical protein
MKNGQLTGWFDNDVLWQLEQVLEKHQLVAPIGTCSHV